MHEESKKAENFARILYSVRLVFFPPDGYNAGNRIKRKTGTFL